MRVVLIVLDWKIRIFQSIASIIVEFLDQLACETAENHDPIGIIPDLIF